MENLILAHWLGPCDTYGSKLMFDVWYLWFKVDV